MTVCHSCSSLVADDSRFCGTCGSPTNPAEAPTRVSTRAAPGSVSPSTGLGSSSLTSDPSGGGRFVPGTLLAGRYRIVGLLGRGGMGEVCRADDLVLGQPVALKFLPEALENDADRLRRFLNEVRIARQISHPNVCRVYDIGEIDGHHFISMEYVDGEDLSSLLRRIDRLPQDKAIQIARQICAGLAAAHDRGVLHRDLKPANVMVDGRGQARITDFGLAALEGEISGAEIHAGTPDFMAPEQLDGHEVTIRSDLYSLGHVLYELFTGKRAFRAKTLVEMSRLQREATPTSPSSLVEGIQPAVERVILRCLEKNPLDRPQSALAVSAALPGGDPLAAALAAGETPSPEMVAAAGPEGGMRPAVALSCLAAVLIGLVTITLLLGRSTLYSHVPMERPVEVLEETARGIVKSFGWEEPPADRVWGLRVNQPALDYFARNDPSPTRWDRLSQDGQIALLFTYRQGERELSRTNLFGRVNFLDPPPEPGDVSLSLGLGERLVYFLATPPFVDHSGAVAQPVDWSVVFEAAKLDMERFTPIAPTIQPQAYADTRGAWEGVLPHRDDLPVRVEAAALRGKIVYFETVTPYDRYWSEETEAAAARPGVSRAQSYVGLTLVILLFVGAMLLARRNWRLGRGDRKGAMRLAFYVIALHMLRWIVTGHHVLAFGDEFGLVLLTLSGALLLAALTWVLYIAIEPYFRRLWPEALVSWSRLLAGRLRDPLVGRDLLFGFAMGIGLQLIVNVVNLLPGWLGLPPREPLAWGIAALGGGRWALGQIFTVQLASLPAPLAYILMFLLLRILLRRQWLATVAFGLILAGMGGLQFAPTGTGTTSAQLLAIGVCLGAAQAVFLIVLMLRFGVLATVGCFLMANLLAAFPITFDPDARFFVTGIFALLLAAGLAGYAFYTSLGGRQLFHDAILQEQT